MFIRTSKSAKVACVSDRRSSRRSSLSASRRILHKVSHSRLRQPLSMRNSSNGARVEEPHPAPLRLPRTLARPRLGEVDRQNIEASNPELAHIPTDYIRKGLALTGADMLETLSNVHSLQLPASTLPKELEIIVDDMIAIHCPTHMLAVYSHNSAAQKRKVTLFPTHQLILAAHCNNMPSFPTSHPNPAAPGSTVQIPVVPMCLPSPETFSILQSYLYTKRIDALLAKLLPTPPPSMTDTNIPLSDIIKRLVHHLAATCSMSSLALHAMLINGVWRNACALGVYDNKLWNAIEVTWGAIVGAIDMSNAQC